MRRYAPSLRSAFGSSTLVKMVAVCVPLACACAPRTTAQTGDAPTPNDGNAADTDADLGGLAVTTAAHAPEDAPLQLRAGEVQLGDKVVALPHEARTRVLDFVRTGLPQLQGLPRAPAPYDVTIAPEVRGAELLSVLQSGAYGGRREAFLLPAEVVLHLRVPVPEDAPHESWQDWPEDALLVDVGVEKLELWRVPTAAEFDKRKPATLQASLPVAEARALLPAALEAECAARICSPLAITLDPEASAAPLLAFLELLGARTEYEGVRPPPQALLLLDREKDLPPVRRILREGGPGRLPAEVIQARIREDMPTMTACYEDALGRNRKLTGKLVIRFVIDRQGGVSGLGLAPESTLEDPVMRTCVLDVFKKLHFPRPEDGIVTVTYPLVFAPQD